MAKKPVKEQDTELKEIVALGITVVLSVLLGSLLGFGITSNFSNNKILRITDDAFTINYTYKPNDTDLDSRMAAQLMFGSWQIDRFGNVNVDSLNDIDHASAEFWRALELYAKDKDFCKVKDLADLSTGTVYSCNYDGWCTATTK
jgi:hypothetical protein